LRPDAGRVAAVAPASASAVRDMAYRAIRDHGWTRFVARRLNRRPPPDAIAALQSLALSQLREGRRAAAVIVDQVVSAARTADDPGLRAAAGFLNATLRRFVRERAAHEAAITLDSEAVSGFPRWWLDLLREAYPDGRPMAGPASAARLVPGADPIVAPTGPGWREIVAASRLPGPLTLRVNRRVARLDAVLAALRAAGLDARVTGEEALTLAEAVPVARIPGFAAGEVTVQDAGAQLAAPLLDVRDGHRVLDACAAPGGKTTHLLQLAACRLLALDLDPARAARIRQNLDRERLPRIDWDTDTGASIWGADVRAADASAPGTWWDGHPFDRILVDAPCSASGIVRRHPDIPWHRRRSDPATFARQQRRLLEALWPLLKAGGKLLYVTCSIFPHEGEAVIQAFRSQQRDCERLPIVARWADGESSLSQLVPTSAGQREHDGYYYALLSKQT
jgi:16S rRNA (cytosine967-C5)-methyltransferase